jgi:hypothetical protein
LTHYAIASEIETRLGLPPAQRGGSRSFWKLSNYTKRTTYMKTKLSLSLSVLSLLTASLVSAATIAPGYDSFGTMPAATFGGTGIPNTSVAATTIANGGDTITLGLTATPRYPNPTIGSPLPDNGAGTFFTDPGVGLSAPRANWNFDYYINVAQATVGAAVYNIRLVYTNNTTGAVNAINFAPFTTSGTVQDSQNLSFAFFGAPLLFDANAIAQYGFQLEAYDAANPSVLLGRSAINVNVGVPDAVPDSGTTLAMLGLALVGLIGFAGRARLLKA